MGAQSGALAFQSEKVNIFRRAIAALFDIYISSVLANIPILIIYSIETGETQMTRDLSSLSTLSGILASVLGILIVSVYYIVIPLYKFDGQTLMKRLLGFKIIKTDGTKLDLKTMLKREILGSMIVEGGFVSSANYLRQLILILTGSQLLYTGLLYTSFATTILSIIFILFSKKQRALHDYIGNTKVLRGGE
ncbi:RDD family protein [Senegalia massiliensis]|uniref:RDD family protein n=1 Tax=Senegalia massiliensis TaxID=1720316 RepID=A0A845QZX5_9CLOT|nr:RDD family protein [Senegalia massiliensis]NBI07046.1 RDD family protein [Senegalia massiliensis]